MFKYKWNLKEGYPSEKVEYHNSKVFSTFACGGGSSMGYKLAGYNVIGANDIDPKTAKVYKKNHKPKNYFLASVNELLNDFEFPKEFYDLDILDGSPPCSTFSISGSREKVWKTNKKFREGQKEQVLSDLFFDWIKLVNKLRPKIAIAENVKGILIGNAKAYSKAIVKELNDIGYAVQIFLLNSATMGVPQCRKRVFFICKRKDLKFPKLKLEFNLKPILLGEAIKGYENNPRPPLTKNEKKYYFDCPPGRPFSYIHPKGSLFNFRKLSNNKVCTTLMTKDSIYHPTKPGRLNNIEWQILGSFPLDYDFLDINAKYLIGMSVPPVMMANLSYEIYKQLLKSSPFPDLKNNQND